MDSRRGLLQIAWSLVIGAGVGAAVAWGLFRTSDASAAAMIVVAAAAASAIGAVVRRRRRRRR